MSLNKSLCATFVGLTAVAVVLSGCSSAAEDRSDSAGGTSADRYSDASNVVVVRNADDVPNVAMFCAEGLRFASTLSGDGSRSPQLLRIPEFDKLCAK